MRQGLLFAVLAVTCVGWVGAEEPNTPASTEPQSWEGQSSDKVIAAWGKPNKIKKDGSGGKVLVYKLRLPGNLSVGNMEVPAMDVGEGPPEVDRRRLESPMSDVHFSGSTAVFATLKVRFYVDNEGIVYRVEFSPVKLKK